MSQSLAAPTRWMRPRLSPAWVGPGAGAAVLLLWVVTWGQEVWELTLSQWHQTRQLQTQHQAWQSVLAQVPLWTQQRQQLMRCRPDCPQRWPSLAQGAQLLDALHDLARQDGLQDVRLSVASTAPQADGWQKWPLKVRASGSFGQLSAWAVAVGQLPGVGPLETLSLAPEETRGAHLPGRHHLPGLVMQAQWTLILQPRLSEWVQAHPVDEPMPAPARWRWRAADPFLAPPPTPVSHEVPAPHVAGPAAAPRLQGQLQQGSQRWALMEWAGRTHAVLPGQAVATSGWQLDRWLSNDGVALSRAEGAARQIQLHLVASPQPPNH